MDTLHYLFSPLRIKGMELANRAVMPPMGTNLGNPDGTVSDANVAYLARRAKGRPGLLITEIVGVHPSGLAINTQLCAFEDRFIPGLAKLAQAAHADGCKVAMQIHHAGRESFFMLAEGKAIAPSAVPSLIYRMPPREMTHDDIAEITNAFGSAARRAREAGFDAVEVHGAHGYLLTQFLSARSNRREDEYGGSLENRARFIIDILSEVRRQVGEDFPVSLRLSVEEFIEGGYTVSDIAPVLPAFVAAGADIIHASFGTHGSPGGITTAPPEYEPGFAVPLARRVKDAISVPVIAVGRFTDPELAGSVIKRKEADLVAFGRQFLADPDFLKKAGEGRLGDTRFCIACNQGCIERLMLGEGKIRCAINPETGQELLYPQERSAKPRRIWVIGAGPAGLTAACEAARLGHNVTLFEKESLTGGLIRYGAGAPHKHVYREWIEWLDAQVRKAGVEIKTGTRVTPEMIVNELPDHVIIAQGSEPVIPPIPGINASHVCTALDIFGGAVKPGTHVVIIGAGFVGMEAADFLTGKAKTITLVEVMKRSPVLKLTGRGYMLHDRLRKAGCTYLFESTITQIEKDSVTVVMGDTEKRLHPVDQVIIAAGMKPRETMAGFCKKEGIPCRVAGDAKTPRRILEATDEGAKAAWEL